MARGEGTGSMESQLLGEAGTRQHVPGRGPKAGGTRCGGGAGIIGGNGREGKQWE